MKRYSSIDAMRAIAAFLVVCIHVPFPNIIGEIITSLARIAVPFFFIVSGFFLYGDNKDVILEKIKKHVKNAFILAVCANVTYFFWSMIIVIVSNRSAIGYLKNSFTFKKIIKLIVFNETQFGYHLWYLLAYVYVLVIYYFITKFNLLKLSYYTIPILLLALTFGRSALLIAGFELPTIAFRNFIFVGMPYFLLGNLIRYKQDYIINKTIRNSFLVLGMFFFSFTNLLEMFILIVNDGSSKSREHYLSTFLLIITIFIFLIKNPLLFKNSILEIIGSKYSLEVYLIHPIFINIFSFINTKIGGAFSNFYEYIAPFIIFLSSISCAIIYANIKKIISTSKLRNLNTEI